jgi:6-phosphofructokinase 1
MASHIVLPPEDDEEQHRHDHDDEEEDPREDEEESRRSRGQATAAAALPFSASCVRISRDSYPNLRTLRNASSMSLADAAYVKISEGRFGYVLDDVPHLTDYLPDLPVSALTDPCLPPALLL